MSTEAKEQDAFDENDIFNFDIDNFAQQEEEDQLDLSEYDGLGDDAEDQHKAIEEEEEEEEPASLFSEEEGAGKETQQEEEAEFTDKDLADFNRKLGKDFKSAQELKDFLNKSEAKDEGKTEHTELEKADNIINLFEPLLDPRITSDEELMRKEYEQIALQKGKDLTDEEVQYEINEEIQSLIDARQLDLRADKLRTDLRNNILEPAKKQKSEIAAKQQQRELEQQKTEKEAMQNALADIYHKKNFYGIQVEKEVLNDVYKKISSGEFLKRLQSDKKALAELAMVDAYREQIYKKSSNGLTYNDGMKAVLDDFKSKKEESSGTSIIGAQKRGTSGGSDSAKGLAASLAL